MILEKIKNLPLGYSEVEYQQKKYGVTTLLEAKKTAKSILANLESATI